LVLQKAESFSIKLVGETPHSVHTVAVSSMCHLVQAFRCHGAGSDS